MKNKNLVSLTIAIAFFLLATTGILLYVKQKAHFIEMTHTIFGLVFISYAIFHIFNNWDSISTIQPYRMEIVAVPEPPAIVLSGIGLASAMYAFRRRRG